MGFIYKVTNTLNNYRYIGKTTFQPQKRWKEHLNVFHNNFNKVRNRPLYAAMQQFGEENFIFEVIEETSNDLLEEREKYWIKYYNTYVKNPNCKGYNATMGGDGTQKIDYKPLYEYYLQTQSKAATAKHFNCSLKTVERMCVSYHIPNLNHSAGRIIYRIDPDDGEIIEYSSIRQAAIEIANDLDKDMQTVRKRINKVLLHTPEQKAYGYYWSL